jgi:hypothetical protein
MPLGGCLSCQSQHSPALTVVLSFGRHSLSTLGMGELCAPAYPSTTGTTRGVPVTPMLDSSPAGVGTRPRLSLGMLIRSCHRHPLLFLFWFGFPTFLGLARGLGPRGSPRGLGWRGTPLARWYMSLIHVQLLLLSSLWFTIYATERT